MIARGQFAKRIRAADLSATALVADYARLATVVSPAEITPAVAGDRDDDQVLACALAAPPVLRQDLEPLAASGAVDLEIGPIRCKDLERARLFGCPNHGSVGQIHRTIRILAKQFCQSRRGAVHAEYTPARPGKLVDQRRVQVCRNDVTGLRYRRPSRDQIAKELGKGRESRPVQAISFVSYGNQTTGINEKPRSCHRVCLSGCACGATKGPVRPRTCQPYRTRAMSRARLPCSEWVCSCASLRRKMAWRIFNSACAELS